MDIYYEKYLKYKNKYLELKKMFGGLPDGTTKPIPIPSDKLKELEKLLRNIEDGNTNLISNTKSVIVLLKDIKYKDFKEKILDMSPTVLRFYAYSILRNDQVLDILAGYHDENKYRPLNSYLPSDLKETITNYIYILYNYLTNPKSIIRDRN